MSNHRIYYNFSEKEKITIQKQSYSNSRTVQTVIKESEYNAKAKQKLPILFLYNNKFYVQQHRSFIF